MSKGTFLIQKEYELSIWGERREYYSPGEKEDQSLKGLLTNIEEYQIARIGFDGMNSPARARDIVLKRNINGTNTLTFSLCSRYLNPDDLYDNFTSSIYLSYKELKTEEKYYENPFISYLTNETRLKLKFDNKWYDFVVKDIQEDSSNYMFHYTAQDLFINELSRSGYDIELSTELENNMGNSIELGQQILSGTDWKVEGEPIKQYIEEPLYRATAAQLSAWKNLRTGEWETFSPNIYYEDGRYKDYERTTIYIFYSCIINQDPFLQCLKLRDGEEELKVDSNNVIINADLYAYGIGNDIENTKYTNNIPSAALDQNNQTLTLETKLRGKRLVRTKVSVYDEELDRTVQKMVYNGQEAYYYEDTYYQEEMFVTNMLGYNKKFTKISRGDGTGEYIQGWSGSRQVLDVDNGDLIIKKHTSQKQVLNTSFFGDEVNNIQKGDYLICLIQTPTISSYYTNSTNKWLRMQINQGSSAPNIGEFSLYKVWNGTAWQIDPDYDDIEPFSSYIGYSSDLSSDLQTYARSLFGNQKGIVLLCKIKSKVEIDKSKLQLSLLTSTEGGETTLSIRNIEVFPFRVYWTPGATNYVPNLIVPNYQLNASELMDNISLTRYNVFKYNGNDKQYLAIRMNPIWLELGKTYFVYDDSYAKITSIEGKESNRFNLIQTICEKFECWANFNIEHDENGKIATERAYIGFDENGQIQYYDESHSGCVRGNRQKKTITFSETLIPQKNVVGFKYGVNLNSITRTVNSDQISTFIIVKNNNNEFAKNGFCSIARASENYSGENSIINFDYYIQMGLLDGEMAYNDLYVHNPAKGQIGYYYSLKEINQQIDACTEHITRDGAIADELSSRYETLKTEYDALYSKYIDLMNQYHTKYGKTSDTAFEVSTPNDYPEIAKKNDSIIETIKKIIDNIREYFTKANVTQGNLEYVLTEYNNYKKSYETNVAILDDLIKQKSIIINKFRSKYSRFIQEGTWIDESYTDDNRYYLDALQVAHTSSKPQVSYNISGVDISELRGYEQYTFDLGQVTTIEDVNFFGYDDKGFPRKEEVVISEITYHLDAPEQNELVIQNYRTQWEDLFQRVAAEVQSLQFAEGSYARAAGIVSATGEIKLSSLQSTIDNNNLTIKNAANQSVVWDDKGITVTSKTNADKILRIVSDGIYVSNDGGITYVNAMRGDGISASLLNAGVINTSLITVANGNTPSFHWDSYGISAFKWEVADGDQQAFDLSTFVRFDQFGLYGIKDKEVDWHPLKLQDVVNEAHFSITWDGFSLRTGDDSGIRITPENHFIIYENLYDDNNNPIILDDGTRSYVERVRVGILSKTNDSNVNTVFYGMEMAEKGIIQLIQQLGYRDEELIEKDVNILTLTSYPSNNKYLTGYGAEYKAALLGLINVHNTDSSSSDPSFCVGTTGVTAGRWFFSGEELGLASSQGRAQVKHGFIHAGVGGLGALGGEKYELSNGATFSTVTLTTAEPSSNDTTRLQNALLHTGEESLSGLDFEGRASSLQFGSYNSQYYLIFNSKNYIKSAEKSFGFYDSLDKLINIYAKDAHFKNTVTIENNDGAVKYRAAYSNKKIVIEEGTENTNTNTIEYDTKAVFGADSQVESLSATSLSASRYLNLNKSQFKLFTRNNDNRMGCFWYE